VLEPPIEPLGPDSLTWRLGFARPSLLYAGRSLIMQVAHPVVGAGVRDFSSFRADPWSRLQRTVDSLLVQMFGGAQLWDEAARLQRLHRTITGIGFDGRPYRALEPEALAWVHLSNFDSAARYFEDLVRPRTRTEMRQHYAEWRQVGLVLGVPSSCLPAGYDEFGGYVEAMVRDRLIANPTCTEVLETLELRDVGPPAALPRPVWAAVRPVGRTLLRDFTVGTLPPLLRSRMGLTWTAADEWRLDQWRRLVRAASRGVPDRLMHYPAAYRAMQAARGRTRPACVRASV
jgi:uncharacterized protein (DUF2236 family)